MNEIKRQLDEKMGDTKSRSNNLIAKINKEKQQHRLHRKTPSSIPYFLTLGSFAVLIVLFFLMSPFDFFQETTSDDSTDEPALVAENLKSYFRNSGDIAHYEGSGSDMATYTVETTWLTDNYVQHVIENNGAIVQRIFRLTKDEVQFVYNQEVLVPESFKKDELDQLPIISVLLKTPLEDGNTFYGKTVSFPETVNTPIGSFDNAVKISEQMEDGVNHVYYVPNEGIVKNVYSFDDGNEVVSVLRSVPNENQQTLKSYFRKSGDVAYYVGNSGDTSTYNVETTWLADNYVQHIINYEATIMQHIYRITGDEIQLVYSGNYETHPTHFELAALDQLPVLSVLLKTPLEDGNTFDRKTISSPEAVDTAIGSFDNTIMISEEMDSGKRHIYYVPNEGIVKEVFSFDDNGSDIISELQSIETTSNSQKYSDLPDTITAVHTKTNENKTINLSEHPALQILLNRVSREESDSLSFTYSPFSVKDSSTEYGILEFGCTNDICTLLFIKEAQGQSQSTLIGYGKSSDSLIISPDGKKAMIGIRANLNMHVNSNSDLYQDRLAFIDLQNLSQIQPAGSEQYQDRPIHEYKWQNENTIEIVTADIKDYSIEAIEEWFKLEDEAPLKELTITLQ